MICANLRLFTSVIISVLLYYADTLSDLAVLANYYKASENGFLGISAFAILISLLAQIIYSSHLSVFSNSVYLKYIISFLYLTPIYCVYKFLYIQCCRLAKGDQDELQLTKMIDVDNSSIIMSDDEEQKEDPNMMDTIQFGSGVLTTKKKINLLYNIDNDMIQYLFIKSCFQSSINMFVQIFVLGEYFLFSDDTRSNNHDDIALSSNDVLSFPDTNNELYLLVISTSISFICLCMASYSQISDIIDSSPQTQLNCCIPVMYIFSAILESSIRVLRFMIVSVVFGAIYGILIIFAEIFWKFAVLSLCITDKHQKRKKKKKRKQKKQQSGYSGNNQLSGSSSGGDDSSGFIKMSDDDGMKCQCCCDSSDFCYKSRCVLSWMLFSREQIKKNPCLMRFTDIVLWTILLLGVTVFSVQVSHSGSAANLNGVCNQFLHFQRDCLPLEVIIGITGLVLILMIIYLLSPSIFNLVSSLDQDIFSKQLLFNHSINHNNPYDEYDSDEDSITVIDISKPVQNQNPQPKKRFRDSNNLMLLSVDDELNSPDYDYRQQ